MWMRWLMDLAAYQGPRRISQINEKPCREYCSACKPARQGRENSKLGGAMPYHWWASGNDGRSNGFHSRVARKLDTYGELMWDEFVSNSLLLVKYILVAARRSKAIELREKLDVFAKTFDRALLIEIRLEQGLFSLPITIVPLSDPRYQRPWQMTLQTFTVCCPLFPLSLCETCLRFQKMRKQSLNRRSWTIYWKPLGK